MYLPPHCEAALKGKNLLPAENGVLRIIQRQFFLFLNKNICCDSSLEPSQQDGSNDG